MVEYHGPQDEFLTEDDVYEALDFLVAVEPRPAPPTYEDYERQLAPYKVKVDLAMHTLRRYAEQTDPMTLEQMQRDYYSFTNDPRYLTSGEVSAVVTGSLKAAWKGVGPWRN